MEPITTMTDSAAVIPTATDTPAVVQTDTQKAIIVFEAALQAIKSASGNLVTVEVMAEISAIETTLTSLRAKAEAEAKVIENDLKDAESKFIIYEQTFAQKYGTAIAHGAEIILLLYIAGRLANVF